MVMVSLPNPSQCKRCPRLQKQFKQLRISHPDYWNQPVLASGDKFSPLLVVGLAPGKHGANKTGIPFTGDSSGKLLLKVLSRLGIEQQVRITNAVKCLPVQNKPSRTELLNCQKFLEVELIEHAGIGDRGKDDRSTSQHCMQGQHIVKPKNSNMEIRQGTGVILALGHVAHKSILRALGLVQNHFIFAHGAIHNLQDFGWLVDSYHCSRYNTQTGRLTEQMLFNAISNAVQLSSLAPIEHVPAEQGLSL